MFPGRREGKWDLKRLKSIRRWRVVHSLRVMGHSDHIRDSTVQVTSFDARSQKKRRECDIPDLFKPLLETMMAMLGIFLIMQTSPPP